VPDLLGGADVVEHAGRPEGGFDLARASTRPLLSPVPRKLWVFRGLFVTHSEEDQVPRFRIIASNDPSPGEITNMINPDGPPSISQLLQSLEWQLEKHIDDNRYVWPITITPNR